MSKNDKIVAKNRALRQVRNDHTTLRLEAAKALDYWGKIVAFAQRTITQVTDDHDRLTTRLSLGEWLAICPFPFIRRFVREDRETLLERNDFHVDEALRFQVLVMACQGTSPEHISAQLMLSQEQTTRIISSLAADKLIVSEPK